MFQVAKVCNTKIYVTLDKYEILKHLDLDMTIFTTECANSNIHVVPMGAVSLGKVGNAISV